MVFILGSPWGFLSSGRMWSSCIYLVLYRSLRAGTNGTMFAVPPFSGTWPSYLQHLLEQDRICLRFVTHPKGNFLFKKLREQSSLLLSKQQSLRLINSIKILREGNSRKHFRINIYIEKTSAHKLCSAKGISETTFPSESCYD